MVEQGVIQRIRAPVKPNCSSSWSLYPWSVSLSFLTKLDDALASQEAWCETEMWVMAPGKWEMNGRGRSAFGGCVEEKGKTEGRLVGEHSSIQYCSKVSFCLAALLTSRHH